MKPLLLARFTPSLTDPEDLEAIFVQREPLAARILSQLEESITTASKHHTLLVGPRGIGKTHLLTLIQHRLVHRPELRAGCLMAWLREEEWGVMSFLDLLLRIFRSLGESKEAKVPADQLDALHDLSPARAEKEAVKLLIELIGSKTLVLLMENLDDIFRGLAAREQAAFRAFLQEHACVTILATTPGLFEGVSRRQSPFFGFFRIQHLEELSFDDAVRLLHKIAVRREQQDLASFILTPTGRARIRAIHHLAQGNPRVYVILSEFLTRQSLDDLVDPVLRMLDDLTPYYQSRLAWLSNQQRKLVEFLASHRTPCVVKELARRCFISPQTASGQLRKLTEWGYVRSENVGRESYYELREPLMRFCMDLKKERKEPLRPLVEILRIWWTTDELEFQMQRLSDDISPMAKYLVKALEMCRKESDDPRAKACRQDFHAFLESEQLDKAVAVAEEWVAVKKDGESMFQLGYANLVLGRLDAAWGSLRLASELDPDSIPVLVLTAGVANMRGEFSEAIRLADQVRLLASENTLKLELRATAIAVKASSQQSLQDYEGGLASCDEFLTKNPTHLMRPRVVAIKAEVLFTLERFEAAEMFLTNAAKSSGRAYDFFLLAIAQYRLGQIDTALETLNRSIGIEDKAEARVFKAKLLAHLGRWETVMPEIDRALMLAPNTVAEWIPTIQQIAFLAVENGPVGLRDFLVQLNLSLRNHKVPEIRAAHIMTLAAKAVVSGGLPPKVGERFEGFFKQLSSIDGDEQVLSILEAFIKYAQTHDESVLLSLPLEARQLFTTLNDSQRAETKTVT